MSDTYFFAFHGDVGELLIDLDSIDVAMQLGGKLYGVNPRQLDHMDKLQGGMVESHMDEDVKKVDTQDEEEWGAFDL